MTLSELAKQYAKKLNQNSNKTTIDEIIKDINDTKYSESGKQRSQDTINELIQKIEDELKILSSESITLEDDIKPNYHSFIAGNINFITENTDTSDFNEIVKIIAKGTKKQ